MRKIPDKNLFRRVKKSKPEKDYDISKRTSRQLDRSEMADFVAHQQRILNTKGDESELAENWERFSNIPKHDSEQQEDYLRRLKAHMDQSNLTPEQMYLEDNKVTGSETVGLDENTHSDADSEGQQGETSLEGNSPSKAGHTELNANDQQMQVDAGAAHLDGQSPSGAGQATLSGEQVIDPQAGQASLAGQSAAGAGQATLSGEQAIDPQAGQASLAGQSAAGAGHATLAGDVVVDTQAGQASLKGSGAAKPDMATMQGAEVVDVLGGKASLQGQSPEQASFDQLQGMSQEEYDRLYQAGSASLQGRPEAKAGVASLEGSEEGRVGNSELEGRPEYLDQVGKASLDGVEKAPEKRTLLQSAQEKMRQRRAQTDLEGHAHIGQKVALRGREFGGIGSVLLADQALQGPGQAQLLAEQSVRRLQGKPLLEGKLAKADQITLKNRLSQSSQVQFDGGKIPTITDKNASKGAKNAAVPASDKLSSRFASRLEKKMAKIREQSADIVKERESLRYRNTDD